MKINKSKFILERLQADYKELAWNQAKLKAEYNYIVKIFKGKIVNLTIDEKKRLVKILQSGYTEEKIKL